MQAQSFSDDFESYTVGEYIAASSSNWTTWSGTNGGDDDVQVVDDNANSGSNSIYFEATSSSGGPDDVVLPFGGQYGTGQFSYSMMMYIESGTGAYFNFQALSTVGQTWALECTITESGAYTLSNNDGTMLTGTLTTGQWIEVAFEIDLDQNEWEFLVDGATEGTFSNTLNQIASIDLYPVNNAGNGLSSFWVDDVSYTYTSSTLPGLNGAVTGILPMNGLTGQAKRPTVSVRNLGNTTITQFDIEVDYDGSQFTESVSGVNLASYDTYEVEFTQDIALASGSNMLTATIKNVNGNASDDDASDDSKSITVSPIQPGLNKMVLVEEGTGTWCGWCPRGAVWMARMQERYPDHFVGIAVHNADPMVNDDYDDAIGNLISGYPSALVDRGSDIDPANMEVDFLDRVVLDATAAMCHDATFDAETNELTVQLLVTLNTALSADWRVAVALTEDGVSGTTTDWAQANYYSFQSQNIALEGAGHDWQAQTNPVPASEMTYDHVARIIAPGFDGLENSFPEGGAADDAFVFEFTIAMDATWNMDNMHLIGMLISDAGQIDNAFQTSLTDAMAADCSVEPSGISATYASPDLQVFPNPASDHIRIKTTLAGEGTALIMVKDVMGRVVYTNAPAGQTGLYQLDLDLSLVNSGLYLVEVHTGSAVYSTKFLKK